jgi:glycosyltransferase involved in cell wall biosynthesis
MPVILAGGVVCFNLEDADSITAAVEQLITDPALRIRLAQPAKQLSDQYSWSRCAEET